MGRRLAGLAAVAAMSWAVLMASPAGAATIDTDHLAISDPNGRWSINEHFFGAQSSVSFIRETGFDQVRFQARLDEALFNNSASCAEVRVTSTRTDGTTATTRTRTCSSRDLDITQTAQGRRIDRVRVQLFEIHADCITNNLAVESCYGGLGGGYGGVLNRLVGSQSRSNGD
jgi:hypothetical protein